MANDQLINALREHRYEAVTWGFGRPRQDSNLQPTD